MLFVYVAPLSTYKPDDHFHNTWYNSNVTAGHHQCHMF